MRKNPTKAEAVLWQLLRGKKTGVRFRRQSPMLGFIADFYAPSVRLVVEVDGLVHNEQRELDARRDRIMAEYQIAVIRFTNRQVLDEPDSVCRWIREAIAKRF